MSPLSSDEVESFILRCRELLWERLQTPSDIDRADPASWTASVDAPAPA